MGMHGGPGFDVPVDGGRIAEFRRALGDRDGSRHLAPPTFVVVADQFDPDFARRLRAGEPWPPADGLDALLHVEQRIELARPVRAGERLRACRLPSLCWHKEGRRGGRLEFIQTSTELYQPGGDVVVRSAWVDVRTEWRHASLSAPTPAASPESLPAGGRPVTLADPVTRTQLVMYVGVTRDLHPLHHDEPYGWATRR